MLLLGAWHSDAVLDPGDAWPTRELEVEGATLAVRDSGGEGPCVVLLHGLGGHAQEWWPVVARLARRYRMVAYDQRGHGLSTTGPERMDREAFVADVEAVLDSVGPAPVVLVGQSMGAHTALLATAAHAGRIAGLVMVEGGVGGDGQQATSDVIDWFRSWPVPFPDVVTAVEYFGGGLNGEAWAAGLAHTPTGLVPRWDAGVLTRAIQPVHDQERWSEWASIARPVLLVRGENGFLSCDEVQRMLRTNEHASLFEVEGAGHDVHLDADALLADLLGRFVEALG